MYRRARPQFCFIFCIPANRRCSLLSHLGRGIPVAVTGITLCCSTLGPRTQGQLHVGFIAYQEDLSMPALCESLADRLLDLPPMVTGEDLRRALGPSAKSFAEWARTGRFPKPIALGLRPLWSRDKVIAHLRKLEAAAERRS